jgi:DNA-binding response OmpR family regulator
MAGPAELTLIGVLLQSQGRVVSRTELVRRAGLFGVTPRRVDVHLVEVRRLVGADNLRNVRGRGWMLLDVPAEVRSQLDASSQLAGSST